MGRLVKLKDPVVVPPVIVPPNVAPEPVAPPPVPPPPPPPPVVVDVTPPPSQVLPSQVQPNTQFTYAYSSIFGTSWAPRTAQQQAAAMAWCRQEFAAELIRYPRICDNR